MEKPLHSLKTRTEITAHTVATTVEKLLNNETMTEEKQNIAIAEFCGWKPRHNCKGFYREGCHDGWIYDLPEYIQSRLNPQIFLDFADIETEARIIRYAVPYIEDNLLSLLVNFLALSHRYEENYSVRDGIQIAKYAQRLRTLNKELTLPKALKSSVFAILGEDALKYFPQDESQLNLTAKHNLRPV
jgi:hypothetical protein